MSLTKSQRAELFLVFDGLCAYCGCKLPEKGWHADHIEAVHREWWKALRPKTTPRWDETTDGIIQVPTDRKVGMLKPENHRSDNYFPSCRACNIDKSCMSIEAWRAMLEQKPRVLRDNYACFRHAERFGLVAVVETKVVFHFEKGPSNAKP